MFGGVDERSLPNHQQAKIVRVKRKICLFRITDADRARRAFDEISVNDRFLFCDKFHLAANQSVWNPDFFCAREVSPDRIDLPIRAAGENVGARAFAFGPERRHARAGPQRRRIEEVTLEPILF